MEYGLPCSLTAKVEAGAKAGGPKLTFDGSATNVGYMFRWQDL